MRGVEIFHDLRVKGGESADAVGEVHGVVSEPLVEAGDESQLSRDRRGHRFG